MTDNKAQFEWKLTLMLGYKKYKKATSPWLYTGFKGKYHINSRLEKYTVFLLKFLREISYKIT